MDAQQFAYWLQGFSELNGDAVPTEAQWKSIREHLGLVFAKVTPRLGSPSKINPQDWNNAIQQTHLQPLRAECSVRPAGLNDGCGTAIIC
jgi:hypothetical protein